MTKAIAKNEIVKVNDFTGNFFLVLKSFVAWHMLYNFWIYFLICRRSVSFDNKMLFCSYSGEGDEKERKYSMFVLKGKQSMRRRTITETDRKNAVCFERSTVCQ